MMAWQRVAPLCVVMTLAGCGAAIGQAAIPPLENPPDAKQIVRSLLRAEEKPAAKLSTKPAKPAKPAKLGKSEKTEKPDKPEKPAKSDAKSAAKPAAKPDKSKKGRIIERAEKADLVTRISPQYAWQISKPRQVNIVAGWVWQVCLKGNDKGKLLYVALFIRSHTIIDARTSVGPDQCESESYEPL
jgi:hypothetical protein